MDIGLEIITEDIGNMWNKKHCGGAAAYTILRYTTPGNYTLKLPAGVHKVKITVAGAGGGGGAGGGSYAGYGGAGGRGGYLVETVSVSSRTISITVGSRGAGGSYVYDEGEYYSAGSSGGGSTVTVNGTNYTASGGGGGGAGGYRYTKGGGGRYNGATGTIGQPSGAGGSGGGGGGYVDDEGDSRPSGGSAGQNGWVYIEYGTGI